MNDRYAETLLDIASRLRQLKGLAGAMSHHGPYIEALVHDLEVLTMAILAGVEVKPGAPK